MAACRYTRPAGVIVPNAGAPVTTECSERLCLRAPLGGGYRVRQGGRGDRETSGEYGKPLIAFCFHLAVQSHGLRTIVYTKVLDSWE